jgi:lipoprotein-releasing system permease protein
MRLRLLGWMAWQNSRGHRAIAALLVVAAAAGVGFQIPNAANLAGYTGELLSYGVAAGWGDVRVRPAKGDRFADAAAVTDRARQVPGVKAVVPVLMLPGALGHAGRFLSLPVAGLDPAPGRQPYRLVAGGGLPPGDQEGVLIGASAAERLGVAVGDRVSLRVIFSLAPRLALDDAGVGRFDLTVRGVIGGFFGAFDPVYVDRRFLASELGEPGAASALFVYQDAPFEAEALARTLQGALPGVLARSWMDDSPLLRASIQASAAIGRLSASMVFFAVAIPMAALLYVSVLQRRREAALLAALGFSGAELFIVIVGQALLLGLLGCALGIGLGYALVVLFQHHPVFAWHSFVVRPLLSPAVVLRSSLLVLAAAVSAALYPAWRAARVDPAPVLRELG